jgi:hypothetical protein
MSDMKCISRDPKGLEVHKCDWDKNTSRIEILMDIKKSIPSIWVGMAFMLKFGDKVNIVLNSCFTTSKVQME